MTAGMNEDIQVVLRGGTYLLDAPFILGPEDSGQNGHLVIYRAFAGEQPLLSGGVSITGWQLHDGGLNIYRAQMPSGLHSRQLYVNGQRAQRARGELEPEGFSVITQGYQAPDAAMAGWANPTDVELVDLFLWKSFRCKVGSIAGGSITMQQPCWSLAQWHTNLGMAGPSWVENAYELLDQEGEWYHDRPNGWIYLIPRSGQNPTSAQVVVPRLETLMALQGSPGNPVHHIRIENLTFAHATWLRPETADGYPVLQAGVLLRGDPASPWFEMTPGNVSLRSAEDIHFSRCSFEHLGAIGLRLEEGSQRCLVEGCRFADISSSAISLGEIDDPNPADARLICADNQLSNNHISDIGQEYFDSPGILLGYSAGNLVTHNELTDLPYSGISLGWGWSLNASVAQNNHITHNRVSYVMQRLVDGGLIYTLSSQPNSSISDNFLHNQVHDYGAIYLDQGSQHFSITDNVIASAPNWAILQPTVQPVAQNNWLQDNHTDTEDFFCCGSQGCCTDWNSIGNNPVFTPGEYPAGAQAIIADAGLQPAFQATRPSRQWIEAEAYNHGGFGVGFMEFTPWDAGDDYRDDNVDVFLCSECENDYAVGSIMNNEWLAYHLFVPTAGRYDLSLRVANSSTGNSMTLELGGQELASVSLPDTGGLGHYQDVIMNDVQLPAGPQLIRLLFAGDCRFDGFALESH